METARLIRKELYGDSEQAGFQYLKAYAIDTLLTSFIFCFFGYFNGCGHTTFVMIQGLIGAFGVRIPVSILMSQLKPTSLFKVGLATPASSFVQLILCMVFFVIVGKNKVRDYGILT